MARANPEKIAIVVYAKRNPTRKQSRSALTGSDGVKTALLFGGAWL